MIHFLKTTSSLDKEFQGHPTAPAKQPAGDFPAPEQPKVQEPDDAPVPQYPPGDNPNDPGHTPTTPPPVTSLR
jgi:hypothetical protein